MVPLPACLCFECGRSCRKAPLIACDYCSLYFHQDCLDPPLTTFPIGRWMCPNHPNHFIDQNLLTSCRVTERIKLWDKYANQRIDQHTVKLDFLRKARTANPLFRTKVKLEGRPRIKVPCSIKYHYKNPPEVDPVHCYQDTLLWPIKNTVNKNEQQMDVKKTDDKKENCIENKEIKETTEINKGEECNAATDERHDQQKTTDINDCTNNIENVETVTDSSKEYNNLKFHARYRSHNVKEGIQLLERPVLEALAQQRLEQILDPDGENYETINCHRRARAALFSLSPKSNSPAFMTYRTFVIGNGPNCDLVLSKYGSCEFISSKHAIIFFDEVRNSLSLLKIYLLFLFTVFN